MKTLFTILFLNICFSTYVYSCRCGYQSIPESIQSNEYIFTGTITSKQNYNHQIHYTFEIDQAWKGFEKNIHTDKHREIISSEGGQSCGFNFEIGKTYIIYGNVEEDLIRVSNCSRTKLKSESQDYSYLDMYIFGSDFKQDSLTFIEAQYVEYNMDPPSNLIFKFITCSTTLFFTNKRFISKKEFLEINPDLVKFEYCEFSGKQIKKLNTNLQNQAENGILIAHLPFKRKTRKRKLIRQLNKSFESIQVLNHYSQ